MGELEQEMGAGLTPELIRMMGLDARDARGRAPRDEDDARE